MIVAATTKLAGVLAWPVSHSLSPRVHGYWLEVNGLDGLYLPLAVRPEHFATAVRMLAALGFRGFNVTLPHKEAALAVVDEVSALARRIGAVNTVIVRADGSLLGENSDAFGFTENLKAAAPGLRAEDGPAVVLGAGGAARAVVAALQDLRAPEIRVLNRTRVRAENLARALGGAVKVWPWAGRERALEGAHLLVNATSLGLAGAEALELSLENLPASAVVNDLVYTPLETPLLAEARRRGLVAIDGLGMLLHQARLGFAAWYGVEPQVTDAQRAFVLAGSPC